MFKKGKIKIELQNSNNKGPTNWQKFQKWNEKWNRIMAAIFGILVFFLLFAIVVVNTTGKHSQDDATTENSNITSKSAYGYYPQSSTCRLSYCTITCTDEIAGEYISDAVDDLLKKYKIGSECKTNFTLTIKSSEFFNKSLFVNWFHANTTLYNVEFIDTISIDEIYPNAFNHAAFAKTDTLIMKLLNVTHLKYGIFKGLHNLRSLQLSKLPIKMIDANILKDCRFIAKLVFELIDPVLSVTNLTGTSDLNDLRTLDLPENNFPTTLNAETFTGVKYLHNLYLGSSRITCIGNGTFDPFSGSIKKIILHNNNLITLPAQLINTLINVGTLQQIYLANNPWQCKCDLSELRNALRNHGNLFMDEVICRDDIFNGYFLSSDSIDICQEIITIDTTTTTPQQPTTLRHPSSTSTLTTTTTTTTKSIENQEITCYDNMSTRKKMIYLAPANHSFLMNEIDTKLAIQLTNGRPVNNLFLIWSSKVTPQTINCYHCLNGFIPICNLTENEAHLFCTIEQILPRTSIFNCDSYYNRTDKPTPKPKNLWLSQADKRFVITLLSSIAIVVFLLSAIGGVFIVRQNLTLMSGADERIVILNRNDSMTSKQKIEIMIMPKGFKRPAENAVKRTSEFRVSARKSGSPIQKSCSENCINHDRYYMQPIEPRDLMTYYTKVKIPSSPSTYGYNHYLEPVSHRQLPELPPYSAKYAKPVVPTENIYDTILVDDDDDKRIDHYRVVRRTSAPRSKSVSRSTSFA